MTRCARPSGSLLAGSSFVQLAAPLLSPSLGLAPSGPEQALFKNAPGVFVSNPGRWFSSPLSLGDIYKQKARTSVQALNLNMAVREGLTRFARPFGSICKKKPVHSYELFLEYGGEGGIRTPDTLPYTHFPGVLLQPLGHLTKLSLQHYWNGR